MVVNSTPVLDRDTLRRTVPSVFATRPIDGVSDRYAFLPTSEVIDIMESQGFFPVKASQSTSRDSDRQAFTKHLIRFRPAEHLTPALSHRLAVLMDNDIGCTGGAYHSWGPGRGTEDE